MAIQGGNNLSKSASLFSKIQSRQRSQSAPPSSAVQLALKPSPSLKIRSEALAKKAKIQHRNISHAQVTNKTSNRDQIDQRLKTLSSSKVDSNSQKIGQLLGDTQSKSKTGRLIASLRPPIGIRSDSLIQAKSLLKKVSQHQVLNLGDVSSGSTTQESALSRKLGKAMGGVPLDKSRLPDKNGSIDIVGHSSDCGMKIEGKTPQQLAAFLKSEYGIENLKTINLVSCESQHFQTEFESALSDLGMSVSNVEVAQGKVAVDRASGKMLDEALVGDLGKIKGHDGRLGKAEIISELRSILSVTNDNPDPDRFFSHFLKLSAKEGRSNTASQKITQEISKLIYDHGNQRISAFEGSPNQTIMAAIKSSDSGYEACQLALTRLNMNGFISRNQFNTIQWQLGNREITPGAAGLAKLDIDSDGLLTKRPSFTRATQESVGIGGGQARRHVVAWNMMRGTVNDLLASGKTHQQIADVLKSGFKDPSVSKVAFEEGLQMAKQKPGLNKGKQELLAAMYAMNSNTHNLWPGDSAENSHINAIFHSMKGDLTAADNPEKLQLVIDKWMNKGDHDSYREGCYLLKRCVDLDKSLQETKSILHTEVLNYLNIDIGIFDNPQADSLAEHQYGQIGLKLKSDNPVHQLAGLKDLMDY